MIIVFIFTPRHTSINTVQFPDFIQRKFQTYKRSEWVRNVQMYLMVVKFVKCNPRIVIKISACMCQKRCLSVLYLNQNIFNTFSMKYKLFVHYNSNENYFSTVLCENAKLFINSFWARTNFYAHSFYNRNVWVLSKSRWHWKKPNPNHYSSDPCEKVSNTELEVWRLFSR